MGLALCCFSCHNAPELDSKTQLPRPSAAVQPLGLHPDLAPSATTESARLPALLRPWLERWGEGPSTVFVAPPVGATTPRPIIVGVHGAGDRAEWSCGGWRLASRASAFVSCPQGNAMSASTFGWASPAVLSERVESAVREVHARYPGYAAAAPMTYAGFSQGANFAEPFLRKNAARFPIAILAEGGYAMLQNPSFASAFYAAGGRRIVLVCGSRACLQSARAAQKGLERAGLETLVVGDERAGHNLNERMQKALQAAWPQISAPVRLTQHAEPLHGEAHEQRPE